MGTKKNISSDKLLITEKVEFLSPKNKLDQNQNLEKMLKKDKTHKTTDKITSVLTKEQKKYSNEYSYQTIEDLNQLSEKDYVPKRNTVQQTLLFNSVTEAVGMREALLSRKSR